MTDRPRIVPRPLTRDESALIREAFPRDERDRPVCVVDGAPRDAGHALCRHDWFALSAAERAEYLGLGLVERARFLLELRDGPPPPPPPGAGPLEPPRPPRERSYS